MTRTIRERSAKRGPAITVRIGPSASAAGLLHVRLDLFRCALTACCVSATGCVGLLHPGTDGIVSLQGRVSEVQPLATCSLQLYRDSGALVREVTVAAEFKRSLTIAPEQHKYFIEISCPGHPGKFRSQVYALAARRTVDLGTIVLKQ